MQPEELTVQRDDAVHRRREQHGPDGDGAQPAAGRAAGRRRGCRCSCRARRGEEESGARRGLRQRRAPGAGRVFPHGRHVRLLRAPQVHPQRHRVGRAAGRRGPAQRPRAPRAGRRGPRAALPLPPERPAHRARGAHAQGQHAHEPVQAGDRYRRLRALNSQSLEHTR